MASTINPKTKDLPKQNFTYQELKETLEKLKTALPANRTNTIWQKVKWGLTHPMKALHSFLGQNLGAKFYHPNAHGNFCYEQEWTLNSTGKKITQIIGPGPGGDRELATRITTAGNVVFQTLENKQNSKVERDHRNEYMRWGSKNELRWTQTQTEKRRKIPRTSQTPQSDRSQKSHPNTSKPTRRNQRDPTPRENQNSVRNIEVIEGSMNGSLWKGTPFINHKQVEPSVYIDQIRLYPEVIPLTKDYPITDTTTATSRLENGALKLEEKLTEDQKARPMSTRSLTLMLDACIALNALETASKREGEVLFVQACKQSVDRGAVMNATTLLLNQHTEKKKDIDADTAHFIIGLLIGRGLLIDDRMIQNERLDAFIELLDALS